MNSVCSLGLVMIGYLHRGNVGIGQILLLLCLVAASRLRTNRTKWTKIHTAIPILTFLVYELATLDSLGEVILPESPMFKLLFISLALGVLGFDFIKKETQHDQHLEKKSEELGQLAAGVSHEINNPAAIIRGVAQIMHRKASSGNIHPENVERYTGKIIDATDRIIRITRGLAFIAHERNEAKISTTEMNLLVRKALTDHQAVLSSRGVSVETRVKASLEITGRCQLLIQALSLLIENSIDAISQHQKPWIRIIAKQEGTQVVVEVIDSGTGIDADKANRMMMPFFTTKPIGSGIGLGLPTVGAILRDHDGTLTYLPDRQNTTFRMQIPLQTLASRAS